MLGFMARVLVQATMPHSKPDSNEYSRKNGTLQVSIMAPSQIGLPYGSYPRLLLAWLTTEAVRTKSPTLHLGDTLTEFMNKLDLNPTGGRWGNITALKEQANRLFGSSVVAYDDVREKSKSARHVRGSQIIVADDWDLWWDPRQVNGEDAGQNGLFSSWVKLSEKFYNQVTDRPVPIDLRAIRALKRSPLALDLYSWSTYRVSYLNKRTEIPWEALQMQFGANYADDAAGQGRRDFKKKLLQALTKVRTVYPELRAQEGDRGLVMLPSPTHVLAKK
ncbi:pirin (plasmid) [Xanthomonas citri pv. citri]|nr:pirin [Xanthomonas citri pv. citri]QYF42752.1 pirin [Xanthomonas citri pv. citri]